MEIIELLKSDGFNVEKVTIREYAGPCPWCGGKDRFRVWSDSNRYWCRQCERSGDAIQYLRDLKGMCYMQACSYLNLEPKNIITNSKPKSTWTPRKTNKPSTSWRKKAETFLSWAENQINMEENSLLNNKGLSNATIKRFRIGWNPKSLFPDRQTWGLPMKVDPKTGKIKKLWIPLGLVIPCLRNNEIIRLRIRRPEPDDFGRYILVSGSDIRPMILGSDRKIWIIVESELDAMLVYQEAGDLIGVIALGSAQARPNVETDRLLRSAESILCALDTDPSGAKQAWSFWKINYQVKRWPCVNGKDPSEMFQTGVSIRTWIQAGIAEYHRHFI